MKIVAVLGAMLFLLAPALAQTSLNWPETIELLAQERTQAETCVETLKIQQRQGGGRDRPAHLRRRQVASRRGHRRPHGRAGPGRPARRPAHGPHQPQESGRGPSGGLRRGAEDGFRSGGTKGLVEDILKAPIEPIVNAISSGVSALWTGHVEKDKLELETIKGQLDAAKWPEF